MKSSSIPVESVRLSGGASRVIRAAADYLLAQHAKWLRRPRLIGFPDPAQDFEILKSDLDLLRRTARSMHSMGRHRVMLDLDQVRLCGFLLRVAVTFGHEGRPGFGHGVRMHGTTAALLQRKARQLRTRMVEVSRWAPVGSRLIRLAQWQPRNTPRSFHGDDIRNGWMFLKAGMEMVRRVLRNDGYKQIDDDLLRPVIIKAHHAARRNKWFTRGLVVLVNDEDAARSFYFYFLDQAGLLERAMPPKQTFVSQPPPAAPEVAIPTGEAPVPAVPEEPRALMLLRGWKSMTIEDRACWCRICLEHGMSRRATARAIGASEGAVRFWLRVAGLPAEFKKRAAEGESARSLLAEYQRQHAEWQRREYARAYLERETSGNIYAAFQVVVEAWRHLESGTVHSRRRIKPYTWEAAEKQARRRFPSRGAPQAALTRRLEYVFVQSMDHDDGLRLLRILVDQLGEVVERNLPPNHHCIAWAEGLRRYVGDDADTLMEPRRFCWQGEPLVTGGPVGRDFPSSWGEQDADDLGG